MMSETGKHKRSADHSSTIRTIADLKPDPKNARKHGERNIGMLERSLEQYGSARSIVVDENGQIIAGHGVVEAAANVGIERVRPRRGGWQRDHRGGPARAEQAAEGATRPGGQSCGRTG